MKFFTHASGSHGLGACVSYGLSIVLALFAGGVIGMIVERSRETASIPVTITQEDITDVPVVTLEGIRDNKVVGEMSGDVRLIIGDRVVVPNGSGSFAVEEDDFLVNRITVDIPEGMRFAASKRGKKYYPIDSASAQSLAPQNRVYFRTAEEAEAAGYVK